MKKIHELFNVISQLITWANPLGKLKKKINGIVTNPLRLNDRYHHQRGCLTEIIRNSIERHLTIGYVFEKMSLTF